MALTRDLLFDTAFLIVIWVAVVTHDFDGDTVVLASLWTLRVTVFERRGLHLSVRPGLRAPSKDPDEYR